MRTRKCPFISQGKLGKATKKMSNKKGTGDKDVSGDVLRSLVEDGLRLMADQKLT